MDRVNALVAMAGNGNDSEIQIAPLAAEATFKERVYSALKDAIVNLDIYGSPEPIRLDERELSNRLGVSRTPIREAVAKLEQEGFVKILPRRGIVVARKTKAEIVEAIQVWAALESMAARLITLQASDAEIATLRDHFRPFGQEHPPLKHIDQYSSANIAFHQALVAISGSSLLQALTDNLFLHVRAIRHRTIFARERAERSLNEHLALIEALESRDTERAERLAREHTLKLADYVDKNLDLN
jgi:DNA-binding GntR family transcriptional regulator